VDGGALTPTQVNSLYNVNDPTVINTDMFGDGVLDISDVWVTYIRSISYTNSSYPLYWVQRFWTNGVRGALLTGNPSLTPLALKNSSAATLKTSQSQTLSSISTTNTPKVIFTAGDVVQGSANQILQIPITATVLGNYPLRVLMMGLTVEPLDGSPALTQAVQFTPNPALGTPFSTSQRGLGNYAAVWLNNSIAGLTGTASIGTLTIILPPTATSSSAYAVHFDHASGSPSGLASFPNDKYTGLITLSSRTNSSYGDGIPDSWRLRWFGTIYNALSVSNACASGDGVSNWAKYVAGVDPNGMTNFPCLNSASSIPGGYTAAIHWPTVLGKNYVIMRAPALYNSQWSVLSTNAGTGGDMQFNDTANGQNKFYRVLILQ
jgi:hypothetical protein